MPTSSFRVRFALVAIFAVLALGFLLSPSQAQPGRPPVGFGSPPPGFSGRPPGGITGAPGGVAGMPAPGGVTGYPPGGITGIPGGIHGSGFSGMGATPGTPGAGFSGTGIHGGTPGTGYSPPRTEMVWRCTRCNFELGRGPVDPGQPSCPGCGCRFDGSTIGPGRFGAAPSAPPTVTTPAPSTPATGGAVPINPFAVGTTPEASAAPSDGDSASNDGSSGRSRTIKVIGIVCGSILFLGAVAALSVVVANASAAKPFKHRPARRRIYDDE